MDTLPFGFDTDASRALQHMEAADATVDSDPVLAAVTQSTAAVEAEAKARTRLDAARRWRDYPRDDLADLERQAADAAAKRTARAAAIRQEADERHRRLRGRATDALNRTLAPPEGRDAAADAMAQHTLREKLATIDPVERELMLLHAARAGTDRPLVRAALEAPKPVWATKTWQPLLREPAAQEARDWLIARAEPSLVHDARTIWRLRRIAQRLELAPWQSDGGRPSAAPTFDVRDGVKVART